MTNERGRDLRYYLDVLKTQSAASQGSVVIDQALWAASWSSLQISLYHSPHCLHMADVEIKTGNQQVVQIFQLSQSAGNKTANN